MSILAVGDTYIDLDRVIAVQEQRDGVLVLFDNQSSIIVTSNYYSKDTVCKRIGSAWSEYIQSKK